MITHAIIGKAICLILLSVNVMLGQPVSTDVDDDDRAKIAANDTVRYLNIPERSEHAIGGAEFVRQVTGLNIADREKAMVREILSGNVPAFSRTLKPVSITETMNGKRHEFIFFATCDYLAIGSEEDYLYLPLTPSTAQYLADQVNCSLPTAKMVDVIYRNAETKLVPQPIPPSAAMTTVPVFRQHTDSIKQQLLQIGLDRSADHILAGHKKDVILSTQIYSADSSSDRVVIYGWHLDNNHPIQPVYNRHHGSYADYSHGIRFISQSAFLNGDSVLVREVLTDQQLSILLSREGVISTPRYPASGVFPTTEKRF